MFQGFTVCRIYLLWHQITPNPFWFGITIKINYDFIQTASKWEDIDEICKHTIFHRPLLIMSPPVVILDVCSFLSWTSIFPPRSAIRSHAEWSIDSAYSITPCESYVRKSNSAENLKMDKERSLRVWNTESSMHYSLFLILTNSNTDKESTISSFSGINKREGQN